MPRFPLSTCSPAKNATPNPCDLSTNGFKAGGETDFILDQSGEQVTEWASDANGNMQSWHSNIWAGGRLLGTYSPDGTLHFYLTDWLGTRRVQLNYAGAWENDCVSLPFGDYESCSPTPTEHLYTGKERDSESGNDYFGARYYASTMGRFLSPDPSQLYFADPTNPQSFNLYGYVLNNPLGNIDPAGLDCIHINVDTGVYEGFERGDCDNSTEEKANSGQYVDGTVNTIYTTTGDSNGVVTGYNGTNDDTGALIAGTFATPLDTSLQPLPDPDEQRIASLVQGIASDTAGFPDVCSGGAFVYAGVQAPLGKGKKPAHGFAGYLGNYDSKEGWSNNLLLEGSKGNASGGAAGGSKGLKGVEGLVFIPFAEAGGGLVSVSKNGLSLGGYAGTPEKFPVGAGGGAYFTITSLGSCAHHR